MCGMAGWKESSEGNESATHAQIQRRCKNNNSRTADQINKAETLERRYAGGQRFENMHAQCKEQLRKVEDGECNGAHPQHVLVTRQKLGAEQLSYMSGHDSGGWQAGPGQTFRTGRHPVGGLSFLDVSGTVHELTGTWAVMRNSRSPQLETRVSCSWSKPTTADPHEVGGAQCGALQRPDLQHIRTQTGSPHTWALRFACAVPASHFDVPHFRPFHHVSSKPKQSRVMGRRRVQVDGRRAGADHRHEVTRKKDHRGGN